MPKLNADCEIADQRNAWDSFFWKLVAACRSLSSFEETNDRHEDVFDDENGDLVLFSGDVTYGFAIVRFPCLKCLILCYLCISKENHEYFVPLNCIRSHRELKHPSESSMPQLTFYVHKISWLFHKNMFTFTTKTIFVIVGIHICTKFSHFLEVLCVFLPIWGPLELPKLLAFI